MRRFPSLRPSLPPPDRRAGQDKDREGQQVPPDKRHRSLLPSPKHGSGQAFVLLAATAMGLALLPGPQSAALAQAPLVRIADGVLRSTSEGGVEHFLGRGAAPGAVQTDSPFACTGLGILSAVAGHGRVFAYEFQGVRGASGQARRLDAARGWFSRQMIRAWTRFAKSGQPMPVAQWPAFTAAHPLIMGLGRAGLRLSDDYAARHQRAFWHGRPPPWSLGSP